MSTTNLTPTQIAHAATNSPELTDFHFMLGDKKISVVFLEFDAYITFLTLLEPLLTSVGASVVEGFNPMTLTSAILKYCKSTLPEMVALIANATDDTVTVDMVKAQMRSPIKMAQVVMMQVIHDQMIGDLRGFFEQLVGLMKKSMSPSA